MKINYFAYAMIVLWGVSPMLANQTGEKKYHALYSAITKHPLAALGIATAAFLGGGILYKYKQYKSQLTWNWEKIDTSHINGTPVTQIFAKHSAQLMQKNDMPFLWGTSTSAHQVESGCTNNNWSLYQQQHPEIQQSNDTCKHDIYYKEDIARMKELGMKAHRFSVEWSKIMPQPGVVNQEALEHYKNVVEEMRANGIEPILDLFHYTIPIWFEQLGGFEHAENISHFVEFARVVFEKLHDKVDTWITFNSPESYALSGWVAGLKPPHRKKDFRTAITIMHNTFEAHAQIYVLFKSLAAGAPCKIGIIKTLYPVDPWWYFFLLDHLGCKAASYLQNQPFYNFFLKGTSVWLSRENKRVNEYIAAGNSVLDFIAVSYYSHGYIHFFKPTRDEKNEIPVVKDNSSLYAEGLYRSLHDLSDNLCKKLNIPIYVVENGIGDTDEAKRDLFFKRYLYALAKAINDGIDVRSYLYWSLMDNYEWGVPYGQHSYGLYHVDFNHPERTRTLKPSSAYFIETIAQSNSLTEKSMAILAEKPTQIPQVQI